MTHESPTPLYFASQSLDKYQDYQFLLGKYADLRWFKLTIDEPKTIDQDIFIRRKIEAVKSYLPHLPYVVEQTGLVIEAWNKLPGIMTDMFIEAVGNEGICRMMAAYPKAEERVALAVTDLGFYAPGSRIQVFRGKLQGHIATSPTGDRGFGWDAIFIPEGHDETFAEMTLEKKHSLSTRMLAVEQFYSAVLGQSQGGQVAQNRLQLRKLLIRHFNKAELADLSFLVLGIDPEDILPDAIKREQVRELILYCDRYSLVPALLEACRDERPHAEWPEFA